MMPLKYFTNTDRFFITSRAIFGEQSNMTIVGDPSNKFGYDFLKEEHGKTTSDTSIT